MPITVRVMRQQDTHRFISCIDIVLLLVDILRTNVSSSKNYQQYVPKWTSTIKSAYQLTTKHPAKHSRASRKRGRKYHEPNAPASFFSQVTEYWSII